LTVSPTKHVHRYNSRWQFPFLSLILSQIKKTPPTKHRRSYRRIRARQKKVSHRNITDGINPSAISTVITDGLSVGNYGIGSNCLPTLYEILTDNICRYIRLYVITDGIYPSVNIAWLVIVWQLSVKYRWIIFIGMCLKYIYKK
jgi:hypothetical protein